jgi:transcriptional repressor NrdR
MVCIYCNNETRVINSRLQKRNNQIWRRRKCEACEAVFTTHESIDLSSALLVKSGASKTPFLADRLFADVLSALIDHKDKYVAAREVTATVIKNLLQEKPNNLLFSSKSISKITSTVLKKFDKHAWLRYVADHHSLQ